MKQGKICVLDIDSQGVDQLANTNMNPVLIFIKAPSLEVLEKRLRARDTDDDDSIKSRLEIAKRELEWASGKKFDSTIVNDDLEKAYSQLSSTLVSLYPCLQ
eukprot:NODE_129_length_16972_cov_2.172643.p17 type:complete len:102 gc:universal NODE_129_length_16972_cov_2.172643:15047-14742(-)